MAKMKKRWVALCSTAIGAIYLATYMATESQATMLQPQQQALISMQTESSQISSTQIPSTQTPNTQTPSTQTLSTQIPSTQIPSTQTPSTPTPSTPTPSTPTPSTPTPRTQTKSLYKEGTFSGTGSNRRGSIQVAVTIKADKITDVEISNFAMHYSERDVVGLPGEVLQKQSAQVDNVSGATYSTRAFEDAIQEALGQAQNS
jgi:uncharacterized protein with FMN-binding domain